MSLADEPARAVAETVALRRALDAARSQCETLRSETDMLRQLLSAANNLIGEGANQLTVACSERETLRAERDKWHAAALSARSERDLFMHQADAADASLDAARSQLASLRSLLADTRPAIVARAVCDPVGLDPSLLPRIDEALAH